MSFFKAIEQTAAGIGRGVEQTAAEIGRGVEQAAVDLGKGVEQVAADLGYVAGGVGNGLHKVLCERFKIEIKLDGIEYACAFVAAHCSYCANPAQNAPGFYDRENDLWKYVEGEGKQPNAGMDDPQYVAYEHGRTCIIGFTGSHSRNDFLQDILLAAQGLDPHGNSGLMVTLLSNGIKQSPRHHNSAEAVESFKRKNEGRFDRIYLTGHSLGGHIAAYCAFKDSSLSGHIFNAYSFGGESQVVRGLTHHHVHGDIASENFTLCHRRTYGVPRDGVEGMQKFMDRSWVKSAPFEQLKYLHGPRIFVESCPWPKTLPEPNVSKGTEQVAGEVGKEVEQAAGEVGKAVATRAFLCVENPLAGLVLDVIGGSREQGAELHMYGKNGTDAQSWRLVPIEGTDYFYLENPLAGLVLDVKGGNASAGTELHMYTKNGSKAQQFKPVAIEDTGYYYLENPLAGLVLDVQGGNPAQCTKLHMWEKNGSKAQWWACPAFADDTDVFENEVPSPEPELAQDPA